MEFSTHVYVVWGIVATLFLLVCRRVRKEIARVSDRRRSGREIAGLAELMRERHRWLCRSIVTRPKGVPVRAFRKDPEANLFIRRQTDAAAGALDTVSRTAEDDPPRAERLLGRARRSLDEGERLLHQRDVRLRQEAVELRSAARSELQRAEMTREYIARQVNAYQAGGYRLAVEAARLHLLGNALRSIEPLIRADAERAHGLLEKQMHLLKQAAVAAARKIGYTRRVRQLASAFPVVAARARATAFSVIRLRLDLDPRVDAATGRVVRDLSSLLRKAEEKMRQAEASVAAGSDDLQQAASDAQQAVMIASIIEQRILAAMEATSTKVEEGQPLRRPTILH